MMKYILRSITVIAIIGILSVPALLSAATTSPFNVVPCGNETGPEAATSCDFEDFIVLIKNIINVLIVLAIPATMIVFTWVGIMLLTAQGDSDKITRARGILQKVVTGFIIILLAWLVVHTLFLVITGKTFNDFLK
jgi:hypothetical protein